MSQHDRHTGIISREREKWLMAAAVRYLLGFFVVAECRLRLSVVEVERIVVIEVTLHMKKSKKHSCVYFIKPAAGQCKSLGLKKKKSV